MYSSIAIFIGLRYLWNPQLPRFKKITTVLSIIGISISVFAIIITMSVMNGFEKNFKENILSFIPHLVITNKYEYVNKIDFPSSILQIKNIKRVTTFIKKEIIVQSKQSTSMGEVIGIDINNYQDVRNYNIKNFLYMLKNSQNHAIIGKKLSEKLNVNIGDSIKLILLSDKKNIFSGKVYNESLFKIIGMFSTNNEIDSYQILINRQDSMRLLNYKKNYITGWRLWLKNPFFLNMKIQKQLHKNLYVLNWKSEKGELFNTIQIEKYIMLFLFILILLVSSVHIITVLFMHVTEKQNTVTILKSHGLSQWRIISIFIVLSSSISIIGNVIGTIFSVCLIKQNYLLQSCIKIFFNNINIPITIIPSQILCINAISILIVMISTLYPTWYIIKLTPSRILSNE